MNSDAIKVIEQYSSSTNVRDIICCFLVFHEIGEPLRNTSQLVKRTRSFRDNLPNQNHPSLSERDHKWSEEVFLGLDNLSTNELYEQQHPNVLVGVPNELSQKCAPHMPSQDVYKTNIFDVRLDADIFKDITIDD